jgi:hypothetical protein
MHNKRKRTIHTGPVIHVCDLTIMNRQFNTDKFKEKTVKYHLAGGRGAPEYRSTG